MVKVLSVASVLALAGAASAAPFQFLSFDVGGGLGGFDAAAPGFTTSVGGFFSSFGGPLPLAAGSLTAAGQEEFDSYFSLDAFGPTARGNGGATNNSAVTRSFYGNYPAASPLPAANYTSGQGGILILGPGTHIGDPSFGVDPATPVNMARGGIGRAPQPFMSGFAPNQGGGRSTDDGIFVGRLTIWAGATLSGGGLAAFQEGGIQDDILVLGGPAVQIGSQAYVLEAYVVATPIITNVGAADGNQDPNTFEFGAAQVIDLWIHTAVIPTPGALALLGIGGLVTIRRRRA